MKKLCLWCTGCRALWRRFLDDELRRPKVARPTLGKDSGHENAKHQQGENRSYPVTDKIVKIQSDRYKERNCSSRSSPKIVRMINFRSNRAEQNRSNGTKNPTRCPGEYLD